MRLIDADALIKLWYELNDIDEEDRGARFVGYTEIPRLTYRVPTIDAVEVVRCKDCKWYFENVTGHYEQYEMRCTHFDWYTKSDDYCSYGERR